MVPLTVTRTGRNPSNTADTIAVRIPGFGTPVTVNAEYLLGGDAERLTRIPTARTAAGTGWVCERHTHRPSDCSSPDHPSACHCGAPGEPCHRCSPAEALPPSPFVAIVDASYLDGEPDA